ncbi:MAG TPA: DUF3078 domain-containing protein [Adhaeribacter sp.]|nr:DUF3078 domain-containing protein [Adhaeribacter sp.]
MKKAFFTFLSFLSFFPTVFAQTDTTQTKYWSWGGAGTVNIGQIALSNWAAGGQNTVSVLGVASLHANYTRGTSAWDNTLNINYGATKNEGHRFIKNDDRLELNLKYGRQAFGKWYYAALGNLKTQLTPTYTPERDSVMSDFFSPAFMLASIGLDYRPSEDFSFFVSPLTGKFTIVKSQRMADAGAFGVDPARLDENGRRILGTGRRGRQELGAYIAVKLKKPVMENISYQSKLELYSSYTSNPKNIDVNWQNKIDMKVNKFISVTIFTDLIYDDDIDVPLDRNDDGIMDGKGPRIQFKETLGVGLSYKFGV